MGDMSIEVWLGNNRLLKVSQQGDSSIWVRSSQVRPGQTPQPEDTIETTELFSVLGEFAHCPGTRPPDIGRRLAFT